VRVVRFENANLLTLDHQIPAETGLLVSGGRIQSSGTADQVHDLGGATIVPGFVDNHCHLLVMASWEASVDCSPERVDSINGLISALSDAALSGGSDWLFGAGYDDLLIAERRHPMATDLDRVSTDRPILLTHGSGHAHVVNTKGLALLGITASTEESPGGTIDRIAVTGEPSGLLLEMGEHISALLPSRSEGDQVSAIGGSLLRLASMGVTSATDAGHTNDASRLGVIVATAGPGLPRVRAMLAPGIERNVLREDQALLADYTKVMLTRSGVALSHGLDELRELAISEHHLGAPGIAMHAVEPEAIHLAAELGISLARDRPDFGVRIEHASEAGSSNIEAVARSGAAVVTQPGFIWSRGDRYVAAGTPTDALYPLRSWFASPVPLAYGSDAPYGSMSPLMAIQAAASRCSRSGRLVGGDQTIEVLDALRLVTRRADGTQHKLLPGEPADFVVLSNNPITTAPDRISEIEVIATYAAGRKIWPLEN
jgi:predicted amidohydrolase YtcJ